MDQSQQRPEGYPVAWNQHHVFIDGEPVAVVALSAAEAKNALCAALDTLRYLRSGMESMQEQIIKAHGNV